jgi:hypothetical protein
MISGTPRRSARTILAGVLRYKRLDDGHAWDVAREEAGAHRTEPRFSLSWTINAANWRMSCLLIDVIRCPTGWPSFIEAYRIDPTNVESYFALGE